MKIKLFFWGQREDLRSMSRNRRERKFAQMESYITICLNTIQNDLKRKSALLLVQRILYLLLSLWEKKRASNRCSERHSKFRLLRNEKQNVIADSGYQKINQEANDRIQGQVMQPTPLPTVPAIFILLISMSSWY